MNDMQQVPGKTEVMRPGPEHSALERVLIGGDLAALTPDQRVTYYKAVCESLSLNMLTKPFDYLELKDDKGNVKLVLYANKGCAEQLRTSRKVSLKTLERVVEDDILMVRMLATLPEGREEEAVGAVALYEDDGVWKDARSGKRYFEKNGKRKPLTALARANAIMKAETKAKRRATLGICGLGVMDSTDVEMMLEDGDRGEPAAAVPEKRLLGMEEDPDLITLASWNHLKAALVASGGTQAELLAHAGVERPGQIRRERFDELLKLARTPRKEWPKPGAAPPAAAPEKPKNGGASPAPAKVETPADKIVKPLPATMQQLDELRKQIKRVGLSDMEVFAELQRRECSKLDDLDEEVADWILQELRDRPDAREPGQEG
jgi:hypothetical protein